MRDVAGLVEHFFRHEQGRLLATLVRRLGPARFPLAEEAVQEALLAALRTWPIAGVPAEPAAWLTTAARNHALDALRREAALAARLPEAASERLDLPAREEDDLDDRLAMMFMCCHPALGPSEQVALTLRCVAGFSVAEIARAFFAAEATIAQRIVRAKRRIAESRVSVALPAFDDIPERLDAVLEVLYVAFNEGYTPRDREEPLRGDLVDEAIRLCALLASHPVGDFPRTHALLALMWFQSSRMGARIDADGAMVPLEEQDRARWDLDRIDRGIRALSRAMGAGSISDYHLLAAIAAGHATEPPDWTRIASVYAELARRTPTFVVRLNQAVAVSRAEGAEAGLAMLEPLAAIPALARSHLLAAARADCLRRMGRAEEARAEYARAARWAPTEPERRYLDRLASLPPQ